MGNPQTIGTIQSTNRNFANDLPPHAQRTNPAESRSPMATYEAHHAEISLAMPAEVGMQEAHIFGSLPRLKAHIPIQNSAVRTGRFQNGK
jgi:hypothetical protein